MVKRILIAGGTGLIGTRLKEILENEGKEVRVIGRSADSDYLWSPSQKEYDEAAFGWAEAVVNLSGAGIADKRWTNSRKQVLYDSRVATVRTIRKALESSSSNVKTWVNASAIGFYGNDSSSKWYDLNDVAGETYLARLTKAWEDALTPMPGIRMATLRIGVVLSTDGGALPELNKFPILTVLGTGKQWMPWIHIDDVCSMMLYQLDHSDMNGVMNGVAPQVVRHEQLVETMSKVFGKWKFAWVPSWILRIALGEMADVVLHGARVSSSAWEKTDFEYQYADLQGALSSFQ